MISRSDQARHLELTKKPLIDLNNNFFSDLCQDDNYVEPTPLVVDARVNVQEVTEIRCGILLEKEKKTATGPDCKSSFVNRFVFKYNIYIE